MENSALIVSRISHDAQEQTLSSKIFLSQLLPNKHFDYNRNRLSDSVEKFNQSKSLHPSYVTFKCQENKSLKNEDKENCNRFPAIHSGKKTTLVEKYFSRNDIVKDRSEMLDQTFSNCLNSCICVNQFSQSTKSNNGESRAVFMQKVGKSKTKHANSKDVLCQKQAIFQKPNNLKQQMKEWALIKKKNEYHVFKLMRKNNYQRMKSNMIIAKAMKELMDKREQLLGKDENSNDTYVLPNQNDPKGLQK